MSKLTHLAARIFSVPLMIERQKMDVILNFLAPRLEIDTDLPNGQAYGPGDTGPSRKSYYVTEDHMAVIDVVGPLVKRTSGSFMSGGPTTYSEVENEFMDAATDPNVEGILLTVDSPGGESTGAFELADLIHSQRSSKPVFAVADGDAFSAAYAIASAADQVFVTKSGGVGSIGVWMMHVDQSEYNKKNGFKPTYLYAGARKIDGNPHEPLTKDAREAFQGEVDRLYGMFVATVARNRSMRESDVETTEAGLFFGDAAVSAGLADRVGGFNDAMAALRDRVKRGKSSTNFTNSSVPAAASARTDRKQVSTMDQEKLAAVAEEAPVEEPIEQPADEEKAVEPVQEPIDAAASALAYAADVTDFCVLAGLPGKISGFLRAKTSVEDVRKELLAARAANEADPIHSHVLPESSADAGALGLTAKTKVSESPVVQAAERLASAGRKEK